MRWHGAHGCTLLFSIAHTLSLLPEVTCYFESRRWIHTLCMCAFTGHVYMPCYFKTVIWVHTSNLLSSPGVYSEWSCSSSHRACESDNVLMARRERKRLTAQNHDDSPLKTDLAHLHSCSIQGLNPCKKIFFFFIVKLLSKSSDHHFNLFIIHPIPSLDLLSGLYVSQEWEQLPIPPWPWRGPTGTTLWSPSCMRYSGQAASSFSVHVHQSQFGQIPEQKKLCPSSGSLVWYFLCIQFNVQFVFNLQYHKNTHLIHSTNENRGLSKDPAALFVPLLPLLLFEVSGFFFFVFFSSSYYFTGLISAFEILLSHCSTCSSFLHRPTNIYRNAFTKLTAHSDPGRLPCSFLRSPAGERAECCSVSQCHWSLCEGRSDRWLHQPGSWQPPQCSISEPALKALQVSSQSSQSLSQVALCVLPLGLVTLHLVREADVLHQGAVALCSLVQWRGALPFPRAVLRAVVAASHQHVPLLGAAEGSGGLGDVREVRQPRDVVQQAARLGVGGIAVGVAVFLLDVPPELPAFPLLQDLGLYLRRGWRRGDVHGCEPGEQSGVDKMLFKMIWVQMKRLTSLFTKQYKMATNRPCGDSRYGVSPQNSYSLKIKMYKAAKTISWSPLAIGWRWNRFWAATASGYRGHEFIFGFSWR